MNRVVGKTDDGEKLTVNGGQLFVGARLATEGDPITINGRTYTFEIEKLVSPESENPLPGPHRLHRTLLLRYPVRSIGVAEYEISKDRYYSDFWDVNGKRLH